MNIKEELKNLNADVLSDLKDKSIASSVDKNYQDKARHEILAQIGLGHIKDHEISDEHIKSQRNEILDKVLPTKKKNKLRFLMPLSLAASLILIFGIGLSVFGDQNETQENYTEYSEEEIIEYLENDLEGITEDELYIEYASVEEEEISEEDLETIDYLMDDVSIESISEYY